MCERAQWRTGSLTNGTCVEVGDCEQGTCVAVTRCETGDCVNVEHEGRRWLVRDSKLGDQSPVLSFDADEWRAFVAAVRDGKFDA